MTHSQIILHMEQMEKQKGLESWGEWVLLKYAVKFLGKTTIREDEKTKIMTSAIEKHRRERK